MTRFQAAHLTRRKALLSAGAAALLVAAPPRLRAQVLTERPVGDGRLRTLSDGHLTLGAAAVVAPDAPEAELETLFLSAGLDVTKVAPPLNVTLLETGERTILFDAGSGPMFQQSAGRLFESLREAGVDPADVTDVAITHAHPDHIWGVLDDFDEVAFPNATFHAPAEEIRFWRSEAAERVVPEAFLSFVAGARSRFDAIEERMVAIAPGEALTPEVEVVGTPGHTPGHVSFMIHGSEPMLVGGDALTHPVLSFQRPRWRWGTDLEPERAAETRLALLDRLAGDDATLVGYHLTEPGLGRVERAGDAWRFIPVELR